MPDYEIIVSIPEDLEIDQEAINDEIASFIDSYHPLEIPILHLMMDARTQATCIECHIRGNELIAGSTIDVPIDPENQPDYRANRDVVEDHAAFSRMKKDALERRGFSNLVAEYTESYDPEYPLKIIGGQHRYIAVKEAVNNGVDEIHGVKVYFGLDADQRLDLQLISNTNIAVSNDLIDRMYETLAGPELRDWCQEAGLLGEGEDFADRRGRGLPITVRAARSFILNYFMGSEIDPKKFHQTRTTPILVGTGGNDQSWDELKISRPEMWGDKGLIEAGKEFANLVEAQRDYFTGEDGDFQVNIDFAEKAMNYAVLVAWAYTAGILQNNKTRLERHFGLRKPKSKDPLKAAVLAKGRHKTDPENYRGLGYRTDPKERGRFVELFFLSIP